MADVNAVKEITAKLEAGVKELFESDKYTDYLRTMSRFHNYSTRNTVLIHLQKPDATRVAGYGAWKSKFNRQVKKGEHGIKIFAPVPIVVKSDLAKLDPETQQPIIGEDGQPVTEELVERKLARFRIVSVFDVSQTDGEPLPELVESLSGDVARYELFMDTLKAVSPLPIVFTDLPEDTDGTCEYGVQISIRNGMSEIQTVSAAIHEITHARLHDVNLLDEGEKPKNRRTRETEAESVSYAVSQYYGIETSANSFGYLAEWSRGCELKELNASLDTIRKTAAAIIDSIDAQYKVLAKERGISLAIEPTVRERSEQSEQPEETAGIVLPNDIKPVSRQPKGETHPVGDRVLLPLLYSDGQFNRTGKRTYVTVEPSIGDYDIYSLADKAYLMTESGRLICAGELDRMSSLTEQMIDEFFHKSFVQLEKQLANPNEWANYDAAAIANRIEEADTHNVPVRELKAEEIKQSSEKYKQEEQEMLRVYQERIDKRVDEIAKAIENGNSVSVAHKWDWGYRNSPVLDLFKLYGIELPLRTQGWVNRGLSDITESGYRYFSNNGKRPSSVFGEYLDKLRAAIKATPIEQMRQLKQNTEQTEIPQKTGDSLYDKFAKLFPDFASGKYSYMRLESKGFEPLSLEYVFGDRISVMHTYEMNGDLCYDPMIEFHYNNISKTMSACVFQQSIPPLYQYIDDHGTGVSVDGNGNSRVVKSLAYDLNSFAAQWFDNIALQGYMPVRANLVIDDDTEMKVLFDDDGEPIIPEPELKLKEYSIGYAFLGNGITVFNHAEEINGDLTTVAHISTEREITVYDKEMPDDVLKGIEQVAQSVDTWASGMKSLPGMPASEAPHHFTPSVAEAIDKVFPVTGPDKPKITEIDMSLPDPAWTVAEMNEYGYIETDMYPLSAGRAVELFDTNHAIYLLYTDNTEALAIDRDEIITFSSQGFCGITKADWENSPVYAAQMAIAANSQGSREAELLYGSENKFGIYQIPDGAGKGRNFRFEPMYRLEALGLSVDRVNYELVYTGNLSIRDTLTNLNKIYADFQSENPERPAEFNARSVSVSDVIVLQWRGDITSHYVDGVGFAKLPSFTGNEMKAEPIMPETERIDNVYADAVPTSLPANPELARLEAEVKAGKSISLLELSKAVNAKPVQPPAQKGKPSLLARLDEAVKQVEKNKQSAMTSNKNERGHE